MASSKTAHTKYTKVIKVVKSPKTGAYTFQKTMVPASDVAAFIAKK